MRYIAGSQLTGPLCEVPVPWDLSAIPHHEGEGRDFKGGKRII